MLSAMVRQIACSATKLSLHQSVMRAGFYSHLFSTSSMLRATTLNQVIRGARKRKKTKAPASPDLKQNPFKKGVCSKVYITKPKVKGRIVPFLYRSTTDLVCRNPIPLREKLQEFAYRQGNLLRLTLGVKDTM